MIRRPPRSTQSRSSAASDVYKRQTTGCSRFVQLAASNPAVRKSSTKHASSTCLGIDRLPGITPHAPEMLARATRELGGAALGDDAFGPGAKGEPHHPLRFLERHIHRLLVLPAGASGRRQGCLCGGRPEDAELLGSADPGLHAEAVLALQQGQLGGGHVAAGLPELSPRRLGGDEEGGREAVGDCLSVFRARVIVENEVPELMSEREPLAIPGAVATAVRESPADDDRRLPFVELI